MNQGLADPATKKDALKTGVIFSFLLKNAAGKQESWYLDLKESGAVGKGAAPAGKKADGEFDPFLPLLKTTIKN
jgi:hypothetical protein